MGKRGSEASESPRNGGARKSNRNSNAHSSDGVGERILPAARRRAGSRCPWRGSRHPCGPSPPLSRAEPPRSASSLAAGRHPYAAPLTVSHGARQGVGSAVAGSYACVGLWQAGVPSGGGGGRMGRRCGSICSWKFSAASASSAQLGLGAAAVTSAGSIDGCEILARHVRGSETQTRQTARGAYCFYQFFRQLQ